MKRGLLGLCAVTGCVYGEPLLPPDPPLPSTPGCPRVTTLPVAAGTTVSASELKGSVRLDEFGWQEAIARTPDGGWIGLFAESPLYRAITSLPLVLLRFDAAGERVGAPVTIARYPNVPNTVWRLEDSALLWRPEGVVVSWTMVHQRATRGPRHRPDAVIAFLSPSGEVLGARNVGPTDQAPRLTAIPGGIDAIYTENISYMRIDMVEHPGPVRRIRVTCDRFSVPE